ncbi:MAG: hypothetical protein ACLTHG_05560, partial [Bifidobacterium catenulatum]
VPHAAPANSIATLSAHAAAVFRLFFASISFSPMSRSVYSTESEPYTREGKLQKDYDHRFMSVCETGNFPVSTYRTCLLA